MFLRPWITVSQTPTSTKDKGLDIGSANLALWFGETTPLRRCSLPLRSLKGVFVGLCDLLPHTGPAVPNSLRGHGKTHQVLGLPSLACPWQWEFQTSGGQGHRECTPSVGGGVGAALGPKSVGLGSQREAMFSSFRMKLNCHCLMEREPHYSPDRVALLFL